MDELVAQTQLYRQSLISYVYRITGSIEEAKDITQETILKYLSSENSDIKNSKAWMFKVATNLSLDFYRSAKNKKEVYIGPWLPEPYTEDTSTVEDTMELDESLSMALLVIMEKLSGKERVAYILYEIFEFSHKEIANILTTSVENSRQLTSRAKKKLKDKKKKYSPSKEEHIKLTNSFLKAIKDGNFIDLKNIFTENITLHTDGGGKAIAARKILYRDNTFISKLLIRLVSFLFLENSKNVQLEPIWFNGSLGLILKVENKIVTSYNFEISNNKITSIYVLRNPDKLKYFTFV